MRPAPSTRLAPAHGAPAARAALGALLLAACSVAACAARPSPPPTATMAAPAESLTTRTLNLPSGRVVVDLYEPGSPTPAPLVVVAHGFWRSRSNMAGWGRHLAAKGFVAAVPDLPAWSDHARNGHAINELVDWLASHPGDAPAVDETRIAVMGFSAGGLATLLASADNPRIRLWVGLDPVDRKSAGETAAARLQASAVIITAEPSSCNAHGNARAIARVLGDRATVFAVPGATHSDAEWPTDWKARLVCGGTSPERQAQFVKHATDALKGL